MRTVFIFFSKFPISTLNGKLKRKSKKILQNIQVFNEIRKLFVTLSTLFGLQLTWY